MNLTRFRAPLTAFLLAFMVTALSSCDLAKGIFKAGFFTAFILIFFIGFLLLYLFRRMRK